MLKENDSICDFFKHTDTALYQAKTAGRNQVIVQA